MYIIHKYIWQNWYRAADTSSEFSKKPRTKDSFVARLFVLCRKISKSFFSANAGPSTKTEREKKQNKKKAEENERQKEREKLLHKFPLFHTPFFCEEKIMYEE